MHIYEDLDKHRNPSPRDLASFGLVFAGGMAAIAAVQRFYLDAPERALVLLAIGGAVLILSRVPRVGRLLYIAWMGLGLTLGFFTAPIVMLVLYVVVIVPVGLYFKATRRDLMRRRLDPGAESYWEDYPGSGDPASYIRQF